MKLKTCNIAIGMIIWILGFDTILIYGFKLFSLAILPVGLHLMAISIIFNSLTIIVSIIFSFFLIKWLEFFGIETDKYLAFSAIYIWMDSFFRIAVLLAISFYISL